MPTPISSSTAYCTADQFLEYHDARKVGDLTRAAEAAGVRTTASALLTDPTLAECLKRASGDVELACLRGEMYTAADLAALTGVGAAALRGLVADLCFWHMVKRRHPEVPKEQCSGAVEALEMLDQLRRGERIFGLQAQAEAGRPDTTEQTVTQIENRKLATYQAADFFGRRGNRNR